MRLRGLERSAPAWRRRTSWRIAVALALLAPISGLEATASAGELKLIASNDLLSSDGGDDLYTAALEIELGRARRQIRFGERMFTDRARGVRHDETFLELGRELSTRGDWSTTVWAGVLRVGRGIAGESVQNEIHQWVGAEGVDLEYSAGTDLFASLRAESRATLGRWESLWFFGRVEAATAPGFRSWVRGELVAEREVFPDLSLQGRFGARLDDIETYRLAPYVADSGWSAGLSVSWRRLSLGWNRNGDGTGTQHLTFGVRLGPAERTGSVPRD